MGGRLDYDAIADQIFYSWKKFKFIYLCSQIYLS